MPIIKLNQDDIEDVIREYYGEGKIRWMRGKRIQLIQNRTNATKPIGFKQQGDDLPDIEIIEGDD